MIDLRSDTVTRPTTEMLDAMRNAELGDDVYGDDPTVNDLEQSAADSFGKEAALFLSSGTQANLIALMTHCQRGNEYICGNIAHNYKYEAGGAAVLGSLQPQPIENLENGELPIEKIKSAIKPDDFHFAQTKLISLENTVHGHVLSMDYMQSVIELAVEHNLRTHLDGARIFNASVALEIEAKEIANLFDSVSVCLSKGLCAPIGSLLVGKQQLIDDARRWRKMLGGGMRQAGLLAAAGKIALFKMPGRLKEDHANAAHFAKTLQPVLGDKVSYRTNMAFLSLTDEQIKRLETTCAENQILATLGGLNRFVFHNDVSTEQTNIVAELILKNL